VQLRGLEYRLDIEALSWWNEDKCADIIKQWLQGLDEELEDVLAEVARQIQA
jgi:hypothetical protein